MSPKGNFCQTRGNNSAADGYLLSLTLILSLSVCVFNYTENNTVCLAKGITKLWGYAQKKLMLTVGFKLLNAKETKEIFGVGKFL